MCELPLEICEAVRLVLLLAQLFLHPWPDVLLRIQIWTNMAQTSSWLGTCGHADALFLT